jgi:hypothetical protein
VGAIPDISYPHDGHRYLILFIKQVVQTKNSMIIPSSHGRTGRIISHIAVCDTCDYVSVPSRAGKTDVPVVRGFYQCGMWISGILIMKP